MWLVVQILDELLLLTAGVSQLTPKEMARKQQMAVIRDTWQAMEDPDGAPGQQKAGGPAKKSTLQCILTLCSYLSFYRELDTRQQYTPIRYCAIQRKGISIQYEQHSKLS